MAEEQPVVPTEQPQAAVPDTTQSVAATVPPLVTPEPPKGGGGRFIFIAIIILVLAIGAVVLGFVSARRARLEKMSGEQPSTAAETADSMTAQYEQMADSDEISSIESDLANTSFEGIDKELAEIDKELAAEE